MNIREAGAALRSKAVSSVELTTAALERIQRLDPQLNSFLTVTDGAALAQARQADAELATGTDRGPLHGLPIALYRPDSKGAEAYRRVADELRARWGRGVTDDASSTYVEASA